MIKLLETRSEIKQFTDVFNQTIGYSNVPWEYHNQGYCYAIIEKGRIVAGFCLIPGYISLRAIRQLPDEVARDWYVRENYKYSRSMCDLTAYFIINPKYGLTLTISLLLRCLFFPRKYYIYTYPTNDKALEKYYARGKPIRIYSGVPKKLPGHKEHMESENVEILTKWGIFRIFWYRITKILWLKSVRYL